MKNFEVVDTTPIEDRLGKISYMCRSGGYVMVKRPRMAPFVLSLKQWAKLRECRDLSQVK